MDIKMNIKQNNDLKQQQQLKHRKKQQANLFPIFLKIPFEELHKNQMRSEPIQ